MAAQAARRYIERDIDYSLVFLLPGILRCIYGTVCSLCDSDDISVFYGTIMYRCDYIQLKTYRYRGLSYVIPILQHPLNYEISI